MHSRKIINSARSGCDSEYSNSPHRTRDSDFPLDQAFQECPWYIKWRSYISNYPKKIVRDILGQNGKKKESHHIGLRTKWNVLHEMTFEYISDRKLELSYQWVSKNRDFYGSTWPSNMFPQKNYHQLGYLGLLGLEETSCFARNCC